MPSHNQISSKGTGHIVGTTMKTGINKKRGPATKKTSTAFIGSTARDDTGGTNRNKGRKIMGNDLKVQLKEAASNLQIQAGDKVRSYAEASKTRTTDVLDDFSYIVNSTAVSIDERLGSEYGEYARRAADAIANFSETLRNKDVDELFEDGRNLARKSPAVAIGVAAVIGFTLVRLFKAGTDNDIRLGNSKGE